MVKKIVILAICSFLLMACSKTKISTDYEEIYDFSALKSFYVLPAEKKIYDNPKVSELDVKRIGQLVPEKLSPRYSQVEKDKADFWVRYFLVVEDKLRVESYNATFGYYRYGLGYRYGLNQPDVKNSYYQQGSIIIDFVDSKTEEVIWRGVTEGRVFKSDSPAKRRERMSQQLTQLFSTFPPQKAEE